MFRTGRKKITFPRNRSPLIWFRVVSPQVLKLVPIPSIPSNNNHRTKVFIPNCCMSSTSSWSSCPWMIWHGPHPRSIEWAPLTELNLLHGVAITADSSKYDKLGAVQDCRTLRNTRCIWLNQDCRMPRNNRCICLNAVMPSQCWEIKLPHLLEGTRRIDSAHNKHWSVWEAHCGMAPQCWGSQNTFRCLPQDEPCIAIGWVLPKPSCRLSIHTCQTAKKQQRLVTLLPNSRMFVTTLWPCFRLCLLVP